MFRICWGGLIFPNCPEMSRNSNWRQQTTRRPVDAWTRRQSGEMQMLPHVFVNVCGSAKFNFAHSAVHLSRICAPLWNAVWQPVWRGCVGFMAEGARGPSQHFYIPVLSEIWKKKSESSSSSHLSGPVSIAFRGICDGKSSRFTLSKPLKETAAVVYLHQWQAFTFT